MSRLWNQFLIYMAIAFSAPSGWAAGQHFERVIFVLFENTNYADAIKQSYFQELSGRGASFPQFLAETHPSQGNYVALTSGDLNGVKGDQNDDLNVSNIADLLEAKGLTWKVYAENWPGNCFLGATSGEYARKHNPFISYQNIQSDPVRCAHIVEASEFDLDAHSGHLPDYSFYVPNIKNDGHDTGVGFADQWYRQKFSAMVNDPGFMRGTLLVSTFDESGASSRNLIYTSLVGPMVQPGSYPNPISHYSLLRMVEDNWDLGTLGKKDATAVALPSLWK